MVFLALFDIYNKEPDFQEFLKKPQNMFSWCFLRVSWYFLASFDKESDFKKILKMPQSVFSWCFLSASKYFLALFDIWAENRIFEPRTGFSKKI